MIGGLLKSASSTALFAALGLIALGAGAPAAKAADLGGDCCSDLEERVAELEATTARKGNRRVSLTVSGQVTTALMAWDDGNDSDVYVVDNTVAGGSLFQFTGSAKISPKLTAGFQLAVGLDKGARMNHVSQGNDDGTGPTNQPNDTAIVVTHANWYLDHSSLGRVTVGRTNTATAGVTTIDLGGTGVIANSSISYTGGSFFTGLGASTFNDLLGGGTVAASGLARANAIMYTTPTIGGFSASVAWGEDDIWDAAVRYAGEHAGFRIAGAVGYAYNHGGRDDVVQGTTSVTVNPAGPLGPWTGSTTVGEPSQWKAGLAISHVGTGLYAQGAYVRQDQDTVTSVFDLGGNVLVDREDAELYYIQAGISKNWTGLGKTALYGEYARVNDGAQGLLGNGFGVATAFGGVAVPSYYVASSTAEVWGLGVVQHIDAAAMELFLSYRHYSGEATLENPGFLPDTVTVEANDLDVVIGGARIKF